MKLSEWLKLNNLTCDKFAEQIGVDQSTVSRLLPRADGRRPKKQRRKPSIELVDLITRETGGAVSAGEVIAEALDQSPHEGSAAA